MRRITMFLALLLPFAAHAQEDYQQPFNEWLSELRQEAEDAGIRRATLNAALEGIQPLDEVIALDRNQPEYKFTQAQYLKRVVPPARIQKARKLYNEHRELLQKISKHYGVQPQYIVALWGIESNFGSNMGNFNVVEALATLAYDGRRSRYFRGELIDALTIIDQGHITAADMRGSWAGAMGQCQFMPKSFLKFAVDYDGDGHKDIWSNEADVFASIANYLHTEGWKPGQGLGSAKHRGSNFNVLLKWNRSRYFATAVGVLADSIVAPKAAQKKSNGKQKKKRQ